MSSYPPDDHVLRDLGATSEWLSPETVSVRAPVQDAFLDGSGSCRLGVISALVDVAGAQVAISATSHDWIATADLSLSTVEPCSGGMLEARARELRVGKNTIVVDASLHGDIAGVATMTFARIPGSATAATAARERVVGAQRPLHHLGGELSRPVVAAAGFVETAAGVVEVQLVPYVANSFGTLNGGVVGLLAEHAAISAAEATGGQWRVTDLTLRYLAQARSGAIVATASVVRSDGSSMLVAVEQVGVDRDEVTSQTLVHLAAC